MFIQSPLAINNELINISKIISLTPSNNIKRGISDYVDEWCIMVDVGKTESYCQGEVLNSNPRYIYNSKEDRDKSFKELCNVLLFIK